MKTLFNLLLSVLERKENSLHANIEKVNQGDYSSLPFNSLEDRLFILYASKKEVR